MNTGKRNLATIAQRRANTVASIERTGPEHFDMSWWFKSHEGGHPDLSQVGEIDLVSCGTTACAAGHAAFANRRAFLAKLKLEEPADTATIEEARAAAKVLGLADEIAGDYVPDGPGSALFYVDNWPGWMKRLSRRQDDRDNEYIAILSLMRWLADHPEVDAVPIARPDDLVVAKLPSAGKRKAMHAAEVK